MNKQPFEQQFSKELFANKLKVISSKIRESTKTSDIKDVITYILNQQQPYKFQLLNSITGLLAQISGSSIKSSFSDLDYSLGQTKRFQTFLILVKYILTYDAKISNYKLIDTFNDLAKKYVFFQKEIELVQMEIQKNQFKGNKRLFDAIKIGVQYLPKLYQKIGRSIDTTYLTNLLDWILLYDAKNPEDLKCLSKYCTFLTKECVESKYSGDLPNFKTAKKLLKLVIEKSNKRLQGTQNLFFLLESIPDTSVFSVITSECTDFNQFAPQVYLKCFQTLTKSALGPQTLRFITAISFSLKQQYKFNILKLVYQQFIIPKVVKYYKFCKPQQEQVQTLVSFYVNGFIDKIQIPPNHLKYFLSNYQLMNKIQMNFWLQLFVILIYERPDLEEMMRPILKQITSFKDLKQIVSPEKYNSRKKDMWVFLDKDLVERKKYKYYYSQFVGIKNQDVNCYMISTMQALYMSGSLPRVLKYYDQYYVNRSTIRSQIKLPLLYCMNSVFNKLDIRSKNITVDDLKEQGPIGFQDRAQQDCQHYMNQLFEGVQKQIDKIADKQIQNEFKQKVRNIFEISIKNQIVCSKCKNKIKNVNEKSYNLSIDYKEVLAQEWETSLEDYTCDHCKWKGTHKMKSKIVKFPDILFVHIKRFHFDHKLGEVKKLEQATILRRFKDYKLEGFICHIGSKVLCGHYTLYYKNPDDPLKWILFDDKEVCELKVDTEDECLENNLKSENTPYIAIYKKTTGRK